MWHFLISTSTLEMVLFQLTVEAGSIGLGLWVWFPWVFLGANGPELGELLVSSLVETKGPKGPS